MAEIKGIHSSECRVCQQQKLINDDNRCLECYISKPRPTEDIGG